MKKALLFILLSAFALTSFAQKEHLEFQGIPLNCDVDGFVQKITAKGWKYNAEMSTTDSENNDWFDGYYFGYKALLAIASSSVSKTVGDLQVFIPAKSISELKVLANELSDALLNKFYNSDTLSSTTSEDGNPCFYIHVADIETPTWLGLIAITQFIDPLAPNLLISFIDESRMKMFEKRKWDL